MSELHLIGDYKPAAKADVIFVHGLGGTWQDTWSANSESFWPAWLATDLADANVWSLEYDASRSYWRGSAMPLIDRATEVRGLLIARGIGKRPLLFVGHSLGGLLIKSLLRASKDAGEEENRCIWTVTRGVVFFATPHSGSHLATLGNRFLAFLGAFAIIGYRASPLIAELTMDDARLRGLNEWYINQTQSGRIKSKVFFEKVRYKLTLIVSESSAIGGVASDALPVEADHFSICKFDRKHHWVYIMVLKFIVPTLQLAEIEQLPPVPVVLRSIPKKRRYLPFLFLFFIVSALAILTAVRSWVLLEEPTRYEVLVTSGSYNFAGPALRDAANRIRQHNKCSKLWLVDWFMGRRCLTLAAIDNSIDDIVICRRFSHESRDPLESLEAFAEEFPRCLAIDGSDPRRIGISVEPDVPKLHSNAGRILRPCACPESALRDLQ